MEPLLRVFNGILSGETPPASFLQATIIPLRKKGDSVNALDYRPISLLQSSYKILAKILATRLQTFLDVLIGGTQEGFVNGCRMDNAVAIMMAILNNHSRK